MNRFPHATLCGICGYIPVKFVLFVYLQYTASKLLPNNYNVCFPWKSDYRTPNYLSAYMQLLWKFKELGIWIPTGHALVLRGCVNVVLVRIHSNSFVLSVHVFAAVA